MAAHRRLPLPLPPMPGDDDPPARLPPALASAQLDDDCPGHRNLLDHPPELSSGRHRNTASCWRAAVDVRRPPCGSGPRRQHAVPLGPPVCEFGAGLVAPPALSPAAAHHHRRASAGRTRLACRQDRRSGTPNATDYGMGRALVAGTTPEAPGTGPWPLATSPTLGGPPPVTPRPHRLVPPPHSRAALTGSLSKLVATPSWQQRPHAPRS